MNIFIPSYVLFPDDATLARRLCAEFYFVLHVLGFRDGKLWRLCQLANTMGFYLHSKQFPCMVASKTNITLSISWQSY